MIESPKHSNIDTLETGDNLVIKATSDLFIATLLSAPKNERILLGLINAVLEDAGQVVARTATVLNPFNVREFAADKQIVLDVRAEDELGRMFNIEIQTTSHAAFSERIIFGWANSFSAQLHAGDHYIKLHPVLCIVITEFRFLDPVDGAHLMFELRERNHPDVVLGDHLQIHVLRLHGIRQGLREGLTHVLPNLRHWLNFLAFGGLKEDTEMSQLVENDPVIMKAAGELQRFTADPEMRELERRRKLWKLEYYSGLQAAREEGFAEGEAKGEAKGEARGKRMEAQAMVLAVLQARFGKVSATIETTVTSILDPAELKSLAAHAATCATLDDFSKYIS